MEYPSRRPSPAHTKARNASAPARWTRGIPGDNDGNNACMDPTQAKIIELLCEVHLLAIKEVERLNLRVAALENQHRQQAALTIPIPAVKELPPVRPVQIKPPSLPDAPDLLNEHQVAEFVQFSVASVRRWRLFRTGPKYLKIGAAVRYRREDVETWLSS